MGHKSIEETKKYLGLEEEMAEDAARIADSGKKVKFLLSGKSVQKRKGRLLKGLKKNIYLIYALEKME